MKRADGRRRAAPEAPRPCAPAEAHRAAALARFVPVRCVESSGRPSARGYNVAVMYTAVTHRIKVTVEPTFEPERSDPDERRFFWRYAIEIANLGDQSVTLMERHWRITDADGRQQDVRGPGVVGEQPTIRPGESFRYASGCPLTTPSGMMAGEYRMVGEDGQSFDVAIPAFSLDSPHGKRVLN
jgi:ApaG protein